MRKPILTSFLFLFTFFCPGMAGENPGSIASGGAESAKSSSATRKAPPEGARFFRHHVGELYGGGVVFHVFFDDQGNEQGLVVSLKDLSTNAPWGRQKKDIPSCESTWNGVSNTASIMDAGSLGTDAAGLCESYARGGQDDWYLPSVQELNKLWNNLYDVNKTLSVTAGAAELGPFPYWSSTEKDANSAWNFGFDFGHADIGNKENTDYVRAIRSYKVIGNSITGVDTDY